MRRDFLSPGIIEEQNYLTSRYVVRLGVLERLRAGTSDRETHAFGVLSDT